MQNDAAPGTNLLGADLTLLVAADVTSRTFAGMLFVVHPQGIPYQ